MPIDPHASAPAGTRLEGPDAETVRAELERILGHRDFEASARTRQLLRYLVEEALAGRGHRLKGYTVATEVFGRGEDFDANLDPIARIQAGRLRRALERYYLAAGGADPVVITVPKGGYEPTFARNPELVAPAGASRESAFDRVASLPAGVSIAVLPLRLSPADEGRGYFSDGLREELCAELSRYQDLVVIPCRRGTLPEGAPGEYGELTRRLGARFVLEGSIRQGPAAVKVSMWLVDGLGGRQIWSQSYSCTPEPSRLVETEEEVARSVAATVGSELGIISQRVAEEARRVAPANLASHEALLRFYQYEVTLDPDAGKQCGLALQAAVEREPEHGPLWAALATLLQNAWVLGLPGAPDPGAEPATYAERGVALAPTSQLARGVLARNYFLRRERGAFLREMEASLLLNPGSPLYLGLAGYSLILADERARGRALLDAAIARNPCHPGWFNHALFIDDYLRGDYEGALQQTLKFGFEVGFWGPLLRAVALGRLGRADESRAAVTELLALVPDFGDRAADLTSRPILSDTIVEALLAGLARAGLPIGARGRSRSLGGARRHGPEGDQEAGGNKGAGAGVAGSAVLGPRLRSPG